MKSFQELREKTLTPAEKKKREEIAKAMERENPGMDMSKKMAIATAQAKKVAEEAELDEATTAQIQKVLGPTKNAQQGIAALKKAFKVDDKKAKEMLVKAMESMEEASQLDELSPKTLSSYAAKASDARGHRGMSTKKVDKRYAGVAKASKRMDKQMEDVEQVDELKTSTLQSYAKKALKTATGAKVGKRMAGRMGAVDRLSGQHAAKASGPGFTKKMRPYKTEEVDTKKSAIPFDGPYKKKTSVIPGKHGEGPSTAKHLARMGLKQFMSKDKKK